MSAGIGIGTQPINSDQRGMKIISLKKRGVGTPTLSGSDASFCTVADTGVGIYTITLNRPFANIPEVHIQLDGVPGIAYATAVAVNSLVVRTFAVDGTTATDKDCDIMLIGSLARDLY